VIFLLVLFMLGFVLLLHRPEHELKEQILTVLLRYGELYGLQIRELIEQDFGRKVSFGSLYPTLRRLERGGFVTARWGNEQPVERGGARRRYYRRTGSRIHLKERKTYIDPGKHVYLVNSNFPGV